MAVDETAVSAWLASLVGPDLAGPPDARLADAGWDSLTLAEVAMAAEDAFGCDLPDELLVELETIADVVHYVLTTAGRASDPPEVSLHVVGAHDEPMLFDWFTEPERLQRFRLRGVTPSPESLHRLVWDNVVSQYIVCRPDGVATGLVTCFAPDHRNRFAHIAAVTAPGLDAGTSVARGLAQFVTLLFDSFDLRKLYAEVLDVNLHQISSALGRHCRHEGRLAQHEFVAGGYADVHILAIYRDDWVNSTAGRICTASTGTTSRPKPTRRLDMHDEPPR